MEPSLERAWSAATLYGARRTLGRMTRCVARARAEVLRAGGELLDALWPRVCWLCRAPVAGVVRAVDGPHVAGGATVAGDANAAGDARLNGGAPPRGATHGPEACPAHALSAPGLTGNRCARCARQLPSGIRAGERCRVCRARAPRFARVLAAGEYAEPLSAWVLALKHGGRQDLARPLARHLAACLAPHAAGGDAPLPRRAPLLCPVPLHPLRRLERGYDQAQLLARALGEALELPVVTPLVRLRATAPQGAEGGRSTRRANVAGAFGLARTALAARVLGRGPLAERDVWLIDDVFTSGSTADACAEVLRRGGARSVTVVVLARAGARAHGEQPGDALAPDEARARARPPPA